VFITCDFIALLLQAAGGAIASIAKTQSVDNIGKDIMVTGVAWQVFSLALFATLCGEYALRVRNTSQVVLNPTFEELRNSRKFKAFLCALGVATLTIFTRSVFRCAELSGGFRGPLANQEVTFMILEGAMISIAVTSLTVCHPGLVFKDAWHTANWSMRNNDAQAAAEEKLETNISPLDYIQDVEAADLGTAETVSYESVRAGRPPST
jgi:hypothetical protein